MALNSIIADSTDNSELQKMVKPQDKVIGIAFGRGEQLRILTGFSSCLPSVYRSLSAAVFARVKLDQSS